MSKKLVGLETNEQMEIFIFQAEDGQISVDVPVDKETVWLSLMQLTELFGRDKSVISRHIQNIFKAGELPEDSTVAKFATVQTEGERKITRHVDFYNLDMIISLGYRVNSKRGIQFRKWATQVLKDHLIKGYTINQKRLKEAEESARQYASSLEQKINQNGGILKEFFSKCKEEFGDPIYRSWLSHLSYISHDKMQVVFNVSSNFIKEWIDVNYKKDLLAIWNTFCPNTQKFILQI